MKTDDTQQLVRGLKLTGATSMVVGTVIGTGIFLKTTVMTSRSARPKWFCWFGLRLFSSVSAKPESSASHNVAARLSAGFLAGEIKYSQKSFSFVNKNSSRASLSRKKIEEKRLREWIGKYGPGGTISERDVDRAKNWFNKHGGLTVFFCRLIPGVRSLISLPAGIEQMSLISFLLWSTAGAALWTTILTAAGYFLSSNFEKVEEYLDPVSYFILGALVVIYIYRVARHSK